jgi:ketosteroid isomerase-like protein
MTDDLIAFVTEMDRCWLERRFGDLAAYLADDVVIVANDGKHRVRGREAAVESYREFMSRSVVDRFQASGYIVTERGSAAVVEYRWDMAWDDQGTKHEAAGREILVLSRSEDGWRVIWRMQSAS